MSLQDISADTLAQLRQQVLSAQRGGVSGDALRRDITTALGLYNYDLQRPAKNIRPFVFVLNNMTPRIKGNGDVATHWKQIQGINTTLIEGGVPEGYRQATMTTTTADKSATYKTTGMEDFVTVQANWAAEYFEDIRARMALNLLYATKEVEERQLLGGMTSLLMGTPTTPTLVTSGTGGSIDGSGSAVTVHVKVVALNPQAWRVGGGVQNFGTVNTAIAIPRSVAVTNPNGKTITNGGGSSKASADAASGSISTATGKVTATVPVVSGAVGYAWYVGTATSHHYLYAITAINSVVITALSDSGNQDTEGAGFNSSTDYSENAYVYDGLLTLAAQNGHITNMATGTPGTGTGLTSDSAGGISEIENMLQAIWDQQRISPRFMLMNSQEMGNVRKKIVAGGSAPLYRFLLDGKAENDITAGQVFGQYVNQFSPSGGQLIKAVLHPDIPPGTMLFLADQVPGGLFPGLNMGQLWEYHFRQDYWQQEWPMTSMQYETGVYTDGVLAHYFPATLGIINNIANA